MVLEAQEQNNSYYKNIFYFKRISEIGGIETFFYELAKKYKNFDIAIIYNEGDEEQLKRLKKYVKCIRFKGQHFKCEKVFFNFNTDIIDFIDAKEYGLIAHGDYKDMINKGQIGSCPYHQKIDKYYGVSQLVCNSFTEMSHYPCHLTYNPFKKESVKPALKLISATRLSSEKGYSRIKYLADELTKRGILFTWFIFTNSKKECDNENVIFLKNRLDIKPFIKNSDFLIQLSDNEGYCYSAVEALSMGVPIVATDLPVLKELGANEKNSIILNFDYSNIDEVINKMITNKYNFIYYAPEDNWKNILVSGPSKYLEALKYEYHVEALDTYEKYNIKDAELNRIPSRGEQWWVSKERLDILTEENNFNKDFIKVIGKRKIG